MNASIHPNILLGKYYKHLKGDSQKLESNTLNAFNKMANAALKDGIKIQIDSAFRSYERQVNIWNNKFDRFTNKNNMTEKQTINEILKYSTIPGTSRHHWGTYIDIIDGNMPFVNNPLNPEKYKEGNIYFKLKKWMDKNSEQYGFYLVYTNDPQRKGFNYEPWHYTYKPVSMIFFKNFIKLNFNKVIEESNFKGKNNLTQELINKYYRENIMGINKKLYF